MISATRARRSRACLFLTATTILTPAVAAGTAFAQEAPVAAPAPDQAAPRQIAMADTGPSATADSGDAATDLGDIVVTATRRAESIQRVPISIQAFGTEKLAERQVTNFADYANLLPSVSFSTLGPGRSEVYFRGISVEGGAFATVGTYLDEIPITTAGNMPDVHVYDVARVEALSGPQGTLFGASSLAGTLRIITNKPDPSKFEAGYDAQVNKYGKGDFGHMEEGFVNLPVTENVAVRLMGFYRKDGGYIDNTPGELTYQLGDDDPDTVFDVNNSDIAKKNFNPVEEYGGRIALGINLDENWTVNAAVTAQDLDARGSFNFDPRLGDLKVHDYNPTYLKDKWYQAALTIEGRIGDFDLVSATGYFERKFTNASDYTYYTVTYDNFGPGYESYLKIFDGAGNFADPTQQYIGRIKNRKFTQEVRLSSPKDWRFHFTIGGFYQRQKNINNGDYYIEGLAGFAALPANRNRDNALNPPVKRDAFYLVENDQTYKDYAAFAEGTFDITEKLMLTGGIRYFKADNKVIGFGGVAGSARRAGCALPLPAERLTCINTRIPYKEDGETHKVNLTWQIDADKMIYGTYSTGFRPGGGNRIAPDNPYKSDTLSNYELGFKTSWDRIFRFNGAVYFEDWKGIQYSLVPFGFQGAGLTVNAGRAHVYGVELDADLRLGGLTLSASGAYNDAKLAEDFCNLGTDLAPLPTCSVGNGLSAAKGTRLPRQPKIKMQGSARYDIPLGDYKAFVQGVGFYQSSSTSNLDEFKNDLLGNTPGFASFDATIGVRRDRISLEFFIQNIFDKRGQLSKNTFCSIEYCADSSRTFPIKPQFFGIRLSQRFE